MSASTCPKCAGQLDDGRVSVGEDIRYVSQRQTGVSRTPTPVRRARACTKCGYLELYLDAAELEKRIGS
jgi:hypothetical protein